MVKNRLLDMRLQFGYRKQKDFAKFLGVSSVNYNRWENNLTQPSVEMVLKIAELLGLKVEDIIYLEKWYFFYLFYIKN